MPSDAQEIRDAIVNYLNAQPFTVSFLAARANIALLRQENFTRPMAYVAPQSLQPRDSTRTKWDTLFTFTITVITPISETDITKEDQLIELVEDIQKSLLGVPMANAKYITNESTQAYFEETEWRDAALFVGTVIVNYQNFA